MQSKVDTIIAGSGTDKQKIDDLRTQFTNVADLLLRLRTQLASQDTRLSAIMDANGINPEEHYAKTMMLYGRKFCGKDVLMGITNVNNDPRYYYGDKNDPADPTPADIKGNYIGTFTGIDTIFSQAAVGVITCDWYCMSTEATPLYRDGYAPSYTSHLQINQVLGAPVVMPTIQNLDSGGLGAGTNEYLLKPGYRVTGWKIVNTSAQKFVYLLNDLGTDYKPDYTKTPPVIRDVRVFEFADSSQPDVVYNGPEGFPTADDPTNKSVYRGSSVAFKTPFKYPLNTFSPVYPSTVYFEPQISAYWYEIEFIIRKGTAQAAAPCNVRLKVKIGSVITLPLATLIDLNTGWEIDPNPNPYGTWTTVDPNTSATDKDPTVPTKYHSGANPIKVPSWEGSAGASYRVGTDIDASIRKLYLKVRAV